MSHPSGTAFTALLSDHRGRTIVEQKKTSEEASLGLDFGKRPVGYYELTLSASSGQKGFATLAVLPEKSVEKSKHIFGTIAHLKRLAAPAMTNRIALLSRVGINYIREGFLWAMVESNKGTFEWQVFDRIVEETRRNGIRVLPVAAYGVDWAVNPSETRFPFSGDLKDWNRFLSALVGRYKARVDHWEIWNEPNLKTYWKAAPNAEAYAELLAASYQTVKRVQPQGQVVTAGLAPMHFFKDKPESHEDLFMKTICEKAPTSFDIAGYHPYTVPRNEMSNAMMASKLPFMTRLISNAMMGRELSAKKIWFTEMGTPTMAFMNEKRAAEYLTLVLAKSLSMPQVGARFWYDLVDDGTNASDKEHHFGLLHYDGTPKPGFIAYQVLIRKLGNADFIRE
ncbi:MAG: beta-galactosidase, partial [Spirochaetia bacterium]|nr:beta-galactosidase [Spirochaetia bacterium]